MQLFKIYDIRGIYPQELDATTAQRAGRAIAAFFKSRKLVVGRDGRTSSPSLSRALIAGILEQGVNVIDVGLVPTPTLYHLAVQQALPGVMVTASHNPKEYNGFKCCSPQGLLIYRGIGLEKIEHIFNKGSFGVVIKKGKLARQPGMARYLRYLWSRFRKVDFGGISVVLDFSNGVGAAAAPIFDKVGIKNKKIAARIDGRFPSHGPNPLLPSATAQLSNAIRRAGADAGAIFDGDADRVLFCDERGRLIPSDFIFLLLAKAELEAGRRGNFYYDLRFSRVVEEELAGIKGVRAKVMRVGNPFYKEALLHDRRGLLGYEWSGHIMYKENHNLDDGIYGALKLFELLAAKEQKLSALVKPYQRYLASSELNFKVKDRASALLAVERAFKGRKIKRIDGLTVYGRDYWFNLRLSATEPLLRLRIEAKSRAALRAGKRKLRRIIRK